MNTVAKGALFEDRVFDAIKRELVSERLGLLPNSCQIFKRKKYYSRNRKAYIEIDISIEVFIPNATNWSFLWAMECKDYKGSLSVSDVEEFHAKVQQIAGDNVKATLILSGALQKSALEYCKSLGIGVLRLLPDDQVQDVLFNFEILLDSVDRSNRIETEINAEYQAIKTETDETINALTELTFIGNCRDFYAVQDNSLCYDWFSLIKTTLSPALSGENYS